MIRKTELIKRIAKEQRLTHKVVNDVVGELERQVTRALKQQDTVQLMSFGRFYARERKAGKVKDIRSGQIRPVAAGRVAAFRAGSLLKKAVSGSGQPAGAGLSLTNPFKRGRDKKA